MAPISISLFKIFQMLLFIFLHMSIFCLFPPTLSAQDANNQVFVIDHMTNPGEVLEEIPLPPSRMEGSFYLDDDWQIGNVYLKSSLTLKNFYLKYDLEHNQLEIKTHKEVKVCPAEDLKKFEWKDKVTGLNRSFLVTTQTDLKDNGANSVIFEVLVDMEADLLQQTTVKVIKSNYVPTVDVGQRNDRVSKKESYFVYLNNSLYPLEKKKNKNEILFKNCPSLNDYVNTQNLKFDEKKDLVQVIKYFNTCLNGNMP